MKKVLAAMIIMSTLPVTAVAQKNTSLKVEIGYTNSFYQKIDPANEIKIVHSGSALAGFNIQQELGKNSFIELGLAHKKYNLRWDFKYNDGYAEEELINAWLIPIRVGARINILNEKIHLVPSIAYNLGFDKNFKWGNTSGSGKFSGYQNGIDSITYSSIEFRDRKFYGLLQPGLGLEFKLNKHSFFHVSANYYRGLKDVVRKSIDYKIDNEPVISAAINSKGDFYSFNIGFRYQLGKVF